MLYFSRRLGAFLRMISTKVYKNSSISPTSTGLFILITLILNVDQALFAKYFRPIACYTMLYKISAKALTNRLGHVIQEVIKPSQAGFIPRRFIADNILLATELIRGYSRTHVSPRCVIKVDIKKAYDSVEWPFLEDMS